MTFSRVRVTGKGPDPLLGMVARQWWTKHTVAGGADFDFTVGRYLVSDENSACQIPIRHNTLSNGDVIVCPTTVPHSEPGPSAWLVSDGRKLSCTKATL